VEYNPRNTQQLATVPRYMAEVQPKQSKVTHKLGTVGNTAFPEHWGNYNTNFV